MKEIASFRNPALQRYLHWGRGGRSGGQRQVLAAQQLRRAAEGLA